MALIFEVRRGGGDNLAYVVGCSTQRKVAVVDPVASHEILEYCRAKKLDVLYVLNTHGHPDHTAGNDVIVNATGAKVAAHPAERIGRLDLALEGGETLWVGNTKIQVVYTPGHTAGSLCFKVNNKLLSGDTLFLSGAGNTRFGGDVKKLFETFDKKLLSLAKNVEVLPGHDYAESNLRFARTIEPDNAYIDHKLKELKIARRTGSVLTSKIAEERRYNPFFRYREPELIESLRSEYPDLSGEPFEVFRLIRELRNNW